MAALAQVSDRIRQVAVVGALVAAGLAVEAAFAEHYIAAPLVHGLLCIQESQAALQVSARPEFGEEIVVVAKTRRRTGAAKTGFPADGHAARAVEVGPARAAKFNCGPAAEDRAAL